VPCERFNLCNYLGPGCDWEDEQTWQLAHAEPKQRLPRFPFMNHEHRSDQPDVIPFIHMLERRDKLPATDRSLIRSLPFRIQTFANGAELVAENSRPGESCMIFKGFAARSQFLRGGERQITALHIAGDFVDLHAYLLKVMDHSVVAIGACEVGYVPHEAIRRVTEQSHHLARLFWLSTVLDGAIQRTWITCLGRRSAQQHMAHLFCELYLRLEAAGIASQNRFEFPLKQGQFADVLGLSLVHVNKNIQKLRSSGLVDWKDGIVIMNDFDRLAEFAEFDATYLSLRAEPR
jgi:CRP-like cAMP-binding protein